MRYALYQSADPPRSVLSASARAALLRALAAQLLRLLRADSFHVAFAAAGPKTNRHDTSSVIPASRNYDRPLINSRPCLSPFKLTRTLERLDQDPTPPRGGGLPRGPGSRRAPYRRQRPGHSAARRTSRVPEQSPGSPDQRAAALLARVRGPAPPRRNLRPSPATRGSPRRRHGVIRSGRDFQPLPFSGGLARLLPFSVRWWSPCPSLAAPPLRAQSGRGLLAKSRRPRSPGERE